MEIKILQVFYGKDGLPYKDKDRQVHFPITGTGFLGASNTTQIKFYYDELDNLDETTWVAVSKLPNGRVGSRVLESHLDSELNEHYALLELDNYYTQYKGDVFISLQGYQGGVDFDYDEENSQYEIHGTPTIAATGSIKFTINYANQFVGSGETDNINFQRILAALGTKLGMRAYSEHVEELPSEGSPDVFYVVNDEPSNPKLANIYVWNQNTRHYIWVGDNTLDLGEYYTKQQGEQFESSIVERVEDVENEISKVIDGAPRGTFATYDALTAANPNHNYIYLVLADGHWYYWNETNEEWTSGGQYLSTGNAVDEDDVFDILHSRNIYDYTKCTDGYYVPYTTGVPTALSGYSYSGYIKVKGLSNVCFSRGSGAVIGSIHVCFYDINKTFISGALATNTQIYVAVPTGAIYMIFSMGTAGKSDFMVESGTTRTSAIFVPFTELKVLKDQKEIDFALPQSGSYFRQYLIACGDMASKNHHIRYHIPGGYNYNLYQMLADSEKNDSSFVGIFVPDYVTIVGDGTRENTILYVSLQSQNSVFSTLNMAGTSGLENLTVKGTNTRYSVHDDFAHHFNNDDVYYRNVKNCIFEVESPVYGNYGSGSLSGAIWKFENCIFRNGDFSWHSNTNFTIPNDITLENCVGEGDYRGLQLKSLASGVINRVHIIGCDFCCISCREETADIGYDFEIDGHGNNDIPVYWVNPNHPIQTFRENFVILKGNTNYDLGVCVYQVGHIYGITSNINAFTGVALETSENNKRIKILTSGYYMARDLGLDNLDANTLLTIDSSTKKLVSTNDQSVAVGIISGQWEAKFVRLYRK